MFRVLIDIASSMADYQFFYYVPACASLLSIIKIIRNFF